MARPRRPAPHRWLLAAALLCGLAAGAAAVRDGVFVGFKESGVEKGGGEGEAADAADAAAAAKGDGSLAAAAAAGGAAEQADSASIQQAAAGEQAGQAAAGDAAGGEAATAAAAAEQAAAADLSQKAEVLGRTVALHTQFGAVRVKLLEELAPRATALVWQLAQQRGCMDCSFYRNEARPRTGFGPPYALLQGKLPQLAETPPFEGNIDVKMGHVCFIPETKDFFVAYGDHPEWGTAHTVWGVVDEWFTVDLIISQQWTESVHPEFGTHMRMLKAEVPLRIAAGDDATYSGKLGPMHYD